MSLSRQLSDHGADRAAQLRTEYHGILDRLLTLKPGAKLPKADLIRIPELRVGLGLPGNIDGDLAVWRQYRAAQANHEAAKTARAELVGLDDQIRDNQLASDKAREDIRDLEHRVVLLRNERHPLLSKRETADSRVSATLRAVNLVTAGRVALFSHNPEAPRGGVRPSCLVMANPSV